MSPDTAPQGLKASVGGWPPRYVPGTGLQRVLPADPCPIPVLTQLSQTSSEDAQLSNPCMRRNHLKWESLHNFGADPKLLCPELWGGERER